MMQHTHTTTCPHGERGLPPRRRAAMTVFELLLSLAATCTVLGIVLLISASLRADVAEKSTRETLTALYEALGEYQQDTQKQLPADPDEAVKTLFAHTRASGMLTTLPWTQIQGTLIVRDGYGRAIMYLPGADDGAHAADFVSAGADGYFGDPTSNNPQTRRAAADNHYAGDMQQPTPQASPQP